METIKDIKTMKTKKTLKRITLIVLALVVSLSMTVTAYGASGNKTVYVMTKAVDKAYDDYGKGEVEGKSTMKYKYDKYGLVKSYSYSDSEGETEKGTFHYNSKHQAIKLTYKKYFEGANRRDYYKTFSYNKNGYISKVKCYWLDGSRKVLLWKQYYTWNKKGQLTKVVRRDSDGSVETTEWYKYNDKGQLIRYKSREAGEKVDYIERYKYNEDGQLVCRYSNSQDPYYPFYADYTYEEDIRTITTYEDKSRETATEKSIETYKNGNLVKDVSYGGYSGIDALTSKANYTYKEIKLKYKYKKAVLRQQACFDYMVSF